MIIASNPDRAMTVREWDPVLQLKRHTPIDICTHPCNIEAPGGMVPVGPRSLTVTALSTGEGCFGSSWLKSQLSVPIRDGETPRLQAKRRSPKSRRDGRVIFE